MYFAVGWLIVRTSREQYAGVEDTSVLDEIDDKVDEADNLMFKRFNEFLVDAKNQDQMFNYQFIEHINNDSGVFQFSVSRNHYAIIVDELLEWVNKNAQGTYGIIYVRDYEGDSVEKGDEFTVIKVANGIATECKDPFLSPTYPTINPSPYA
jgi:hypothetical protein